MRMYASYDIGITKCPRTLKFTKRHIILSDMKHKMKMTDSPVLHEEVFKHLLKHLERASLRNSHSRFQFSFRLESRGAYGYTPKAFIFSLNNKEGLTPFKSMVKKAHEAIYRGRTLWPNIWPRIGTYTFLITLTVTSIPTHSVLIPGGSGSVFLSRLTCLKHINISIVYLYGHQLNCDSFEQLDALVDIKGRTLPHLYELKRR